MGSELFWKGLRFPRRNPRAAAKTSASLKVGKIPSSRNSLSISSNSAGRLTLVAKIALLNHRELRPICTLNVVTIFLTAFRLWGVIDQAVLFPDKRATLIIDFFAPL